MIVKTTADQFYRVRTADGIEHAYLGTPVKKTAKSSRSDNPAEFDALVRHVRQSRINSGRSQARCVAYGFGCDFGFDPADLLAAAYNALTEAL